jgi:hypothetical protein
MEKIHFEMAVDGVPYDVRATPYTFNMMTRFNVSYNGSEEFVFAWDEQLGRLVSLGDDGAVIPDNVERAISERLYGEGIRQKV